MAKRTEIIKAAIKLFSKKGYFSTSVQEIAEECSMSKGSLYKFFESKEDLLIQVFQYNLERMLEKARGIDLNSDLTEREKLKRVIEVEMEGMLENKDFFNILSKSLPVNKNEKIVPVMKRTRAVMINWHKYCLEQAFGDKASPYIWDLTMMLQGMIKEFVQLITQENKQIEVGEVAGLLVESLYTFIHHAPDRNPVLTDQLMKEYENPEETLFKSKKEQQAELLEEIKRTIEIMDVTEQRREELHSTVQLLKQELYSDSPRSFLIQALVAYLDKEKQMKPLAEKLKIFI